VRWLILIPYRSERNSWRDDNDIICK
jgi:hypothetical protein